ncbi:hypothetical protein RKE29_00945 [Streptomyces sp. B1866]|uniref:hypothetical protein n=1 Tax=Streptomyces sp. B1866 TaxID=3075431 RepID=UPI00288FA025|nr:hypothetical protein [Streptomyces sp. B1866]MDT3395229.1 hypothetical protein [Streptomyces sp. B1866]
MKLAVGDVVRERSDMALGTVVGFAGQPGGNLIVLQIAGGAMRLVEPSGLEIIARHAGPMTRPRRFLARVVFVLAVLAAYSAGQDVRQSGAAWSLTLLAGFGGFMAVLLAHHAGGLAVASLRRFRV